MAWTKEKQKEYARLHYLQHRELYKQRAKEWRKNNKDRKRLANQEYHKKYLLLNGEKLREYSKKYRLENPEKAREMIKNWKSKNKYKLMSYNSERRSKKRGDGYERIKILEIYKRDKWICQLCHKKVNQKIKYPNPLSASIDHIIPIKNGGKHCASNVQLAHLICNVRANIYGIKQLRMAI